MFLFCLIDYYSANHISDEGAKYLSNSLHYNSSLLELDLNFSALTSITLSASLTSIGERAFSGCSGLLFIEVDENNCHFCSQNGVLFSKDFTTLIAYPPAKSERICNIPSAVTSIGEYAFFNCSCLTSIYLPDSLTSIGKSAFNNW